MRYQETLNPGDSFTISIEEKGWEISCFLLCNGCLRVEAPQETFCKATFRPGFEIFPQGQVVVFFSNRQIYKVTLIRMTAVIEHGGWWDSWKYRYLGWF